MKSLFTSWLLDLKLEATCQRSQLKNAEVLDLTSHGLEECPRFQSMLPFNYMTNLKCLCLQSNLLVTIPRINCYCLQKLKALTLDYNRLEGLPFNLRHVENLTILNISHNNFQNVHFFYVVCNLKNLKILWANSVGLTEIPIEIGKLTNLRKLGLRRNRIKQLPEELMSLTNLRWLTLSQNKITYLPSSIRNLTELVHLNLQRNCISVLPQKSLRFLKKIQYLYLDYNILAVDDYLKSLIRSLPNLIYCSLSGNITSSTTSSRASISPSLILQDVTVDSDLNDIETVNTFPPTFFSQSEASSLAHFQGRESNETGTNVMIEAIRETETEHLNNAAEDEVHNRNNTTDDEELENMIRVVHSGTFRDMDNVVDDDNDDMHTVYRQRYGFQQEISSPPTEWTTDSTEHRTYISENDSSIEDAELVDRSSHTNFNGQMTGTGLVFHQQCQQAEPNNLMVENSENDIQLPFANSSTISYIQAQPLGTQEVSPAGGSSNGGRDNSSSSSPGIISIQHQRVSRIQEWVMLQQQDNSTMENNLQMDIQEEQFEEDKELLQGMVSELIDEAVISTQDIGVHNIPSVTSSTNMVYIIPSKRDSQPLHLRMSVTTCNINNNNTASNNRGDVVLSEQNGSSRQAPSQSPLENTFSRSRLAEAHQHQPTYDNEYVEISSSEALSFQTTSTNNSSDLAVISSYFVVENEDSDLDYDPTDWEHSAPSSAIDDQDIIMRFEEFRDEGELHIDENFVDFLIRKIIPICSSSIT